MNEEILWDDFLNIIIKKTNPVSFNTWFNNITLLNIKDNKITIKVPYAMHKKVLSDNYYSLIEDTFMNLTGINYDIDFILEDEIEDTNRNIVEVEEKEETRWESNLIENYTFDNFVVGDTNRFAKTAAVAVTEQPGKIYNPLFIYGKSGLGKTHLMHAIGNEIMKKTNKKVLYTTSDMFMNDFTGLAKTNDNTNNLDYAQSFKEKYRNKDFIAQHNPNGKIRVLVRETDTKEMVEESKKKSKTADLVKEANEFAEKNQNNPEIKMPELEQEEEATLDR